MINLPENDVEYNDSLLPITDRSESNKQCVSYTFVKTLNAVTTLLVLLQFIFDQIVVATIDKFGVVLWSSLSYTQFCFRTENLNTVCIHIDKHCQIEFSPLHIKFDAFERCNQFQAAKQIFYAISGIQLLWAAVTTIGYVLLKTNYVKTAFTQKLFVRANAFLTCVNLSLSIVVFILLSDLPGDKSAENLKIGTNLKLQILNTVLFSIGFLLSGFLWNK